MRLPYRCPAPISPARFPAGEVGALGEGLFLQGHPRRDESGGKPGAQTHAVRSRAGLNQSASRCGAHGRGHTARWSRRQGSLRHRHGRRFGSWSRGIRVARSGGGEDAGGEFCPQPDFAEMMGGLPPAFHLLRIYLRIPELSKIGEGCPRPLSRHSFRTIVETTFFPIYDWP